MVLLPEDGELKIRITGDLAGFLTFIAGMEKPAAKVGDGPIQREMVAGARNHLNLLFDAPGLSEVVPKKRRWRQVCKTMAC